MAGVGQFQVGQLYKGGLVNGLKVWTQPGGIGTQVFPAVPSQFPAINMGYPQVVMSYPAYYYFLCLHPLNTAEVFEVYDPYLQEQMALVCCPMCSLIQSILPYSQYQSYIDTPIYIG